MAQPTYFQQTIANFQQTPKAMVGLALVVLGTFCFSLKSIFIKLAYGYGIDTTTLMMMRMLMAFPFYLVILMISVKGAERTPSNIQTLQVIAIGCVGYYLASYLDLAGLNYLSASLERLILFSYPIFVLLFGALFFAKKITLTQVVASGITYAGVAVALSGGDLEIAGTMKGVVLVVGSAIAYACFLLGSERLAPQLGSKVFTSIAMLAAGGLITAHFSVTHSLNDLVVLPQVYFYAFLLAFVSTVIPSYLIVAGVARIGAANTAIVGAVGPIFTAGVAYVVLNENYTIFHIVGTFLVIVGIYVINQKKTN